MYPENRNTRRVTCQARFLGASSTVLRGDIIDVSNTGLCLALDEPLEKGRELHLEFELPTGKVEAVGEVRWVVKKDGRVEVGIRFVRISAESLGVIALATSPKPTFGGGTSGGTFWWSQFALRR
jgi:hypothetical protein